MNSDLLYWMLLAHSESLKSAERLAVLRAAKGRLEDYSRSEMAELPEDLRQRLRAVWDEVAREGFLLERLRNQDIRVVVGSDPLYPERLKKALKTATPLVLYGVGEVSLLNAKRAVAIVGSRDANPKTLELTRRASRYLAREGYVVVSGYAKGVDQAAFEGTLGNGQSIAVLPQGILDKSSQGAVRKHSGAVNAGDVLFLSELHPQAVWQARFAMMRNRIVTALADVTIVAQTGLKETVVGGKRKQSGTWNAAKTAKEQGRRVFVFDLPHEGNQALIREGLGEALPVTGDDTMFHYLEDAISAGPAAPRSQETGEMEPSHPNHPSRDPEEERFWRELEDPVNRPRLLALIRSVLEELSLESVDKGVAQRAKTQKKTKTRGNQSPLIPPDP